MALGKLRSYRNHVSTKGTPSYSSRFNRFGTSIATRVFEPSGCCTKLRCGTTVADELTAPYTLLAFRQTSKCSHCDKPTPWGSFHDDLSRPPVSLFLSHSITAHASHPLRSFRLRRRPHRALARIATYIGLPRPARQARPVPVFLTRPERRHTWSRRSPNRRLLWTVSQ
jgi:hypothetical protein